MDLSPLERNQSAKFNVDDLECDVETSSSSYLVNSYLSIGLVRLTEFGISLNEFQRVYENPTINIIYEIGLLYVETWYHIQFIRNEARKVRREVKNMRQRFCTTFMEDFLSKKECSTSLMTKSEFNMFLLWHILSLELPISSLKHKWERKEAENTFIQLMEDTFQGTKYRKRRRKEVELDRKLWRLYNKFKKIGHLLNEEELMLPRMLGQMRREITKSIALPDLLACHGKMKDANAKLKRAERKWILWKLQYDTANSNSREFTNVILFVYIVLVFVFCLMLR